MQTINRYITDNLRQYLTRMEFKVVQELEARTLSTGLTAKMRWSLLQVVICKVAGVALTHEALIR